jgi:iron complex outermembrane receptor protein
MNCRKLLCNLILPAFFLLLSTAIWAQTKTITGRVTDAGGSGIGGATVTIKGSNTATSTANDGTFSLTVPANANTLVFSSVGYGSQEMAIGTQSNITITLQNVAANLNEVVVVGYGTARRKDVTGSVTTVTSKDFQKGNITTPEQLIAGKVAGVSVISNGGQPGQGSTIRIRGGSSLNASNDPLIVIDGVPLANNRNPDGTSSVAGTSDPLSMINPNDIESFTVLKDASAAAIYGTRAANGVIIITTKKGRGGQFRASFNTVNSLASVIKTVDVLSADQVRSIVNEKGTAAQKAMLGNANTDWQDEIYQKAFASDNNISLTGGIKGLPYRLSLGYLNQEGILKTDKLERSSVSVALNPTMFDNHLRIDLNFKGTSQKTRFANQGAIGTAVYFDPTQPVYAKSNRYGGYFEWVDASGNLMLNPARNPVGMLNQREDNGEADRTIGNVQFDYKFHFLPELRANLNLGYDASKGEGRIFISDSASLDYRSGGTNNIYKQRRNNTLLEFYLNYAKDLASIRSRFDVMAGYSYNNFWTKNYNFANFTAKGVKKPNSDPAFPFDIPENTLLSYFGRLNYTFNDRYLLTATLRRDGSSRFSPENRWGLFPSVALAWKIKDESFLKNNNTVSDLKLRLGYGVTGQQEGIGNYDYISYYALSGLKSTYQIGNTFYQMFRPGGFYANRKWEETETYNAALDYGFLDNRITGSLDFYIKKTSDLLNRVPQPAGTNFSAFILANVGSMENKGVEFNINGQAVRSSKLTVDLGLNATYNKNTITNLTVIPEDPNYIGLPATNINGFNGFAFLNAVGTSRSTFYLYHQIYDQNGKPIEGLFEDVNRDGIINDNDKYKGKRADPNLFLGFSANATYGKLSGGFTLRSSFNNYVYNNVFSNNGRLNQILGAEVTGNASAHYLTTGFAGNSDLQGLSDYYLENASFLRMDNFNIGYNFGKLKNGNTSLRANLSAQNVFVITKYSGLDPEVGNGVDNNLYPRPRTFSLGLNLDF